MELTRFEVQNTMPKSIVGWERITFLILWSTEICTNTTWFGKKRLIILDTKDKIVRLYLEHAHQVCIHQSTEPAKSFKQQRYHVIGLRKALARIRFYCFLCRRFDTKNIQPIMAPLPSFRFPKAETQFPFANSGVDFFGPF